MTRVPSSLANAARREAKSRIVRAGVSIAGGYLVYGSAAWFLGKGLEGPGIGRWILWLGLWILGAVAAAFLFRSFAKGGALHRSVGEVLPAIRSAESVLRESSKSRSRGEYRRGGGGFGETWGSHRVRRHSAVLVMGDAGGGKTSAVLGSGLPLDLLAGTPTSEDAQAPTQGLNIWLSGETVLLEAGGRLLEDTEEWATLCRQFRGEWLRPMVLGHPSAPRSVVLVQSLEALEGLGSPGSVAEQAGKLRVRLGELTESVGEQLPVYVVFSRTDGIPGFSDFVRHLTPTEAGEVVGATIPLPFFSGSPRQNEDRRGTIERTLQRLLFSISRMRLPILSREMAVERRSSSFEFPRELGKRKDAIAHFLSELARPSQLAVSPFLRGFYFSGFRDTPYRKESESAQPPKDENDPSRKMRREAVFLRRVFRDVVLRDRTAMAVTQVGTQVRAGRRWVLGVTSVVCLLFSSCFTASYLRNRGMENSVRTAGRGALTSSRPSEALADMETLRARLVDLQGYAEAGVPFFSGFGLYHGDEVYSLGRTAYLEALDRTLLDDIRTGLLDSLHASTTGGSVEFQRSYDLLRAYRMVTTEPARIDSAFLAPILVGPWVAGPGDRQELQSELARRQLEFFAGPLCGNPNDPCPANQGRGPPVAEICASLERLSPEERYYSPVLARAASGHSPVHFSSGVYVRSDYTVPAAFTKEGWIAAHNALAEEELGAEAWVCSGWGRRNENTDSMRASLESRYQADFVAHWREYLSNARIVPFGSTEGAVRVLRGLADPPSEIVDFLTPASVNTSVDSMVLRPFFGPLWAVVPPPAPESAEREGNPPYQDYLNGLTSLADVAGQENPGPAVDAALSVARNAGNGLLPNDLFQGESRPVANELKNFLLQPVEATAGLFVDLPLRELRQKLERFCDLSDAILGFYPFQEGSRRNATRAEVEAVFHPQNGTFWTNFEQNLREFFQQGDVGTRQRFVRRPNGPRPTEEMARFINAAADVSIALWPRGPATPMGFHLHFAPHPAGRISRVIVTINGQRVETTPTDQRSADFPWPPVAGPGDAQVAVDVGGTTQREWDYQGLWALFDLFQHVRWDLNDPNPLGVSATWNLPNSGEQLKAYVVIEGIDREETPGFFASLERLGQASCEMGVVR